MQYRFENKYDLLRQCYQDSEIKRSGKALMQYLVYISNKQQCVPAVDTIAAALSISKRTVQRHMRTLEQRGYIVRKSRYYNHEQLTNQYVFNFGVTTDAVKSDKPYPANQGEPVKKVDIIQSVMDSRMHVSEKVCYIYLTHICNKAGYVRKSLQDIARATSISLKRARAIIYRLIRKGLLKGASLLRARKEFILYARMTKLVQDVPKLQDVQGEECRLSENMGTEDKRGVKAIENCRKMESACPIYPYDHKVKFGSKIINWAGNLIRSLKNNLFRLLHLRC